MIKFLKINHQQRQQYQQDIIAIEKTAAYPLGDDFFQLDHGLDYFAFFDRLGEVNYYIAFDTEYQKVAAVGTGILREISDSSTGINQLCWYLCDLKVHPDYQHQNLSIRILRHAILSNIRRCQSGYAISMNPGYGSPNRLARVFSKFKLVKFSHTTTLGIYSLDADLMTAIAPLIIQHRGAISYLSLGGIKDLRLQSTNQILPLLHVQWGSSQKGDNTPIPEYTHLFCVPQTDQLASRLATQNIYPSATATIISHGMDDTNWQFILTSDI